MSGGHHHENAWAGQGAVLLDIGGDVGALVVTMPTSMVDLEVEIAPVDSVAAAGPALAEARPHVAVVERPTHAGVVPSLVFPELEAGTYALSVRPDGPVAMTVTVRGGQVTTTRWRS
jgi:hypothetical protein